MNGQGRPPRCRGELACTFLYCVAAVLATWLESGSVEASLSDDVDRLRRAWSSVARVERLRPRILARGDRLPTPLPAWSSIGGSGDCTSLAFMSDSSVSFVVHAASAGGMEPVPSQIGWAQLTRCGSRRAELQTVAIEMRSPRGVIEGLVASDSSRLPSPGQALAHRDPGPAALPVQAGPAPVPPPLGARVRRWETLARAQGAARIESQLLRMGNQPMPLISLRLDAGCHRVSALSLATSSAAGRDLDLFVRGEPGSELTRQDQSENTDAEIELCVASPRRVDVGVLGLPPADPAVLEHALYPLPEGLPEGWGFEIQARFAEAFFRRRFRGSPRGPVHESLGIAGRTLVPLELEAQTCYVAATAVLQGGPKALLLEATPEDGAGSVDSTNTEPALALAFCTGHVGAVRLRVEAVGPSLAWLLALWRVGHLDAEFGEP